MIVSIALLTLGVIAAPHPGTVSTTDRPRVQVWTNRGDDAYTIGQPVRVSFQTEQDAYVTLFRVDTDGRVRVLFPREPWEDNFARGGRVYDVPGLGSSTSFEIDDDPGVGYLFGVASADPFAYDAIETADHWDYRSIADDGRVRGDPYVALTDLAEHLVPPEYAAWDYDLVPYYVQQHYQYPRFLCYDCHSYVSYSRWNPYDYSCVRFRIVVFDDPYYYPYRQYGGTRVVFTRPYRPEPRFIFKDRAGGQAFVTRVAERPVNDNLRRDVGVRGRDLGGSGTIPPPNIDWRRRPEDRPRSGDNTHPDRPAQPDRPANPGSGGDRPDRRGQPAHPDRPDGHGQPNQPDHPDHPDQPGGRGQHNQPEHPDHPDHPARPDNTNRREEPPRSAPPRTEAAPHTEPRREPARRAEPRTESKRDGSGDSGNRVEVESGRRRR
jgi:hypothetical protein